MTDRPALVFGGRIGAAIALELTARHPEQVRCAIVHEPPLEPDVRPTPPGPDRLSNLEFLLTHDAPAVRRHRPDVAAIRTRADRIIPAVGVTGTGPVPRCARALAQLLQTEVTTFPGGHNGYMLRPRAFADRLRQVLEASTTS